MADKADNSALQTLVSAVGTILSGKEEEDFREWMKKYQRRYEEMKDYDLRGAFKEGLKPNEQGHLPDTYKLPSHTSFSSESIYSDEQNPGGIWRRTGGENWEFSPSAANLKYNSPERIIGALAADKNSKVNARALVEALLTMGAAENGR